MKSLTFIAVTFLAAVNAANVTFKLIAPDATDKVQVNINGKLTTLSAPDSDVPYYTGVADLTDNQTYKYVVDGKSENFSRTLSSKSDGSSSLNEFYGREITYATNIPELPSILTNGSWTRGDTSNPIWDSNYIPSIFVTANEDDMNNLIENVPKNTYSAKITYIGPDQVHTFKNCTLGLHKPGRKNNDAKQTWVWALPEGKFMANRNWFKIRHQEEDPTQIREKLYADIARKMGTYANEANLVRFFVNKEGMGTFNMLDDVIMYSYINAMFYNGDTPDQMGALYDGGSGADFNPATGYDNFVPNTESPLDQDALAPFAEAFAAVDYSNDEEVAAISEYFDTDQFLRFMVMEYLTGSWDAYWMEQTNDGAYIDTASDPTKLYYLAQDFDATFGVNLPYEKDFINVTVNEWPSQFPAAFLINKLVSNPAVNATFRSYLKTTVDELFNMDVLKPYVEARHEFMWQDLVWDRSIKQRSPGNIFGWTAEQTKDNLYEAVTAPGKKSGGAQWGLLEWIEAKEAVVRRELKISSSSSSTTTNTTNKIVTIPAKPVEVVEEDEFEEDPTLTAASVKEAVAAKEEYAASAASKAAPQVLSAIALVAVVAALF
ncbi:MAG: coth protein-domain-containing protein [Benjaminiella poitrasii]|nr:MAG: coth protein-domain-containing protein [Benjaminiella poitrasii]